MNAHEVREVCLSLKGAGEEILWQNDLVFKVAGKMFACTGLEPESGYSFKCSAENFHELTELPGVDPAPYLARAQWVKIDPSRCTLDPEHIAGLIRESYALVVAKMSRKQQRAIEEL